MKKHKLARLLAPVCVLALLLSACGGEGKSNPEASGAFELEVTTLPTKTEYAIGEEVSFAGGELTVTNADGSTATVSLEDEGVTLSEVNTDSAGKKSVTVNYGGERTRFDIIVNPYIVTFDMGGHGSLEPVEVTEAGPVENMPVDPTAEDAEFDGWYYNAEYSDPFDPDAQVTEDITLYAKWIEAGTNYLTVTFDLGYTGAPEAQVVNVEENATVSQPSDPTRVGYSFNGWFADPEGTTAYDFSAPVTAPQTAYATWTRTASGSNEYIFEAEDVDLTGKRGNGYSGEAEGKGLIQREAEGGPTQASNNRFVGYTYTPQLCLDFYFVSDQAVSDATIVARLSGEFADLTLTPDMFTISLNGESIDYGKIEITDVPAGNIKVFEDFVLVEGASLLEGENHLSFLVNNDVNWIGGGTVAATAPVIDNVKITTSAVLWWDGNHGLPADNY